MSLLPLLISGLGMGASPVGQAVLSPTGPDTMPGWSVTGATSFAAALAADDGQYVSTLANQVSGQIPIEPSLLGHICGIEVCLTTARVFTLQTAVVVINIYDGQTLIASPEFEVTSPEWQRFHYHLTSAELGALDDLTDLRVTIQVSGIPETGVGGSPRVDFGELCFIPEPCGILTTADPVPDPPVDPPDPTIFTLEPESGVRLNPRWPVVRIDQGDTLETDGPNRHTRRAHERQPRRYELAFHLAPPEEVELVREAVAATLGGATAVGWRHPTDDPPAPEPLTHYRIVNAHEAAAAIARAPAGQSAEFTLTFEEI